MKKILILAGFFAYSLAQETFCQNLQDCMQKQHEYCQMNAKESNISDKCKQARLAVVELRCEQGEHWACQRAQSLKARYNKQKATKSAN